MSGHVKWKRLVPDLRTDRAVVRENGADGGLILLLLRLLPPLESEGGEEADGEPEQRSDEQQDEMRHGHGQKQDARLHRGGVLHDDDHPEDGDGRRNDELGLVHDG